jgi:CRP/FNR family transcriptional regulator, cyclic AMP receptor protein
MARAVSPSVDAPVLDLDPDLGAGISEEDWEDAREACRGDVVRVPGGRWHSSRIDRGRDDLVGALILHGVLCREVSLRDRCMLELLGPGDVLQPPVDDGPRLGGGVELTAVSDLLLVVLGQAFIRAAARWPSLVATLQRRLESHRENFAIQALIAHLPRAEERLLLVLCHLAERWGYVSRDGVVLPLALTHELLGQLIAARRSTTTLAVRELKSDGLLRRLEDGSWLLTPAVERRIDACGAAANGARPFGQALMLAQLSSRTTREPVVPAAARQIRRQARSGASRTRSSAD